MKRRYLPGSYLAASLTVLGLLIWLTVASGVPTPPALNELLPGILFVVLIIFTDVFGVRLAGGVVSLLPMTTVAAYLVMGPIPTGWAALIGAIVHAWLRHRWAKRLGLPRVAGASQIITVGAANVVAHTASVLVGGMVFQALQGEIPLTGVDARGILALVLFALTYLLVNHLAFFPAIAVRSRDSLRHYIHSLPNIIFYEGLPLTLAPLMALIYTRLGVAMFILFALSMVVASLITRSLAQTSERLQRRVQELRGLQAVGRALSANLDIEAVVSAIYEQVSRLMPARNFYVSLYDPQVDEVSFPLAVEEGARVQWRSRRTGSGLTEYVLRSREPLLIRGDIGATLDELGIASIGRPAECWLGVPILAADEVLGIIAVQSYETAEAYDLPHQKVLTTIAAQAAVAIQNARLYARTDEALARRLQELNSILRTAREGILLLDTDWRVVAANRALANLVGVAQLELSGHVLDAPRGEGNPPLIGLLGYSVEDLRADCRSLEVTRTHGTCKAPRARGDDSRSEKGERNDSHPKREKRSGLAPRTRIKQAIVTLSTSNRHIERTLTPVRSPEGTITGWLLVLRDVTEEIELGRLKDDMTYMLVHDLRSPLTVLGNSFTLMEDAFAARDSELFGTFVEMAQRSSDRMLDLVNGLLDVSELESDELELNCETVDVRGLLQEVVTQLSPLAAPAEITLEVSVTEGLPPLHVDVGLIRRVLNNLVDNAIKFTPDESRVRVWAQLDPEGGQLEGELGHTSVLIGVSDEGPGIPEDEQHKLFEKFHHVSSVKGRRSGSGLGLPFCKLAVEAHGGKIWVESPSSEISSAEAGSTFLLTLPAEPADASS